MTEYSIRIAKLEDKQAVYDFLCKSFFEMPLFYSLNITKPPAIEQWPAFQEWDDNITLIAELDDGTIVGVGINAFPKIDGCVISPHGKIEIFYENMDKIANGLLTHLKNTFVELQILSVSPEHRRKGIAQTLINKSENLAKSKGYSSIYAIATGMHMKSGFRKKGWELVYTFAYKDYTKVDQDFKVPLPPNENLDIFEKKL